MSSHKVFRFTEPGDMHRKMLNLRISVEPDKILDYDGHFEIPSLEYPNTLGDHDYWIDYFLENPVSILTENGSVYRNVQLADRTASSYIITWDLVPKPIFSSLEWTCGSIQQYYSSQHDRHIDDNDYVILTSDTKHAFPASLVYLYIDQTGKKE